MAFKQIKAKPLKGEAMLNEFKKLVTQQAKFSDNEFKKTYRTFKHKPSFRQEVKTSVKEFTGSALTTGDGSTENPYPFITKGTAVRYAVMTPDFKAKTTVRTIGSGSGRGGLAYIDKRKPLPGIKAREFEQEIAKQEQPKFKKRGEAAMKEAVKKSGHKL